MLARCAWVAVLVAAGSSLAQTRDGESAKTEFVAGERAFQDDDYALALQHFRKAMQLAPRDAVRFNLAVCLERLGRFREANREYEAAAHSAELDEAARARAREQSARTRERLGTVKFESAVNDAATVFLGDERLGTMPLSVFVDPTAHDFEVRTPERSLHTVVRVGRGETKVVQLGLTPLAASPAPSPIGPLSWVGSAVALAGTASFIGFGLRASQLHQQYLTLPTTATREQGMVSRDIANASLGLAIAGAVLVGIDVLWHALRTNTPPPRDLELSSP